MSLSGFLCDKPVSAARAHTKMHLPANGQLEQEHPTRLGFEVFKLARTREGFSSLRMRRSRIRRIDLYSAHMKRADLRRALRAVSKILKY